MSKRHSTEEQKAQAAARRERFRSIVKQVAAMTDDQRLALAMRCPVVTCEGRALSQHNQCLIGFQNPEATIVGGFRQWLAQGRAVRKGEHGVMIWIPTRKGDEEQSGTPSETGFVMGTVFDVSQTEPVESREPAICAA